MPRADVVVVGAGLAGLTCGLTLAEGGARVLIVAAGQAASHWAAGPLDVAAPPGAATSRAGLATLAATAGHPYAVLADDVEPALTWLAERLAAEGLPYTGDLDAPLRSLPTGLGRTRPGAIAPQAMAAALPAWQPGERLLIVGFGGFKDLWPAAVAASLRRPAVWQGGSAPTAVSAIVLELAELSGRRNLNALHLARLFDEPGSRLRILEAIARAVERASGGPARIGLPAALGLHDHAAVLDEVERRLPWPAFELPLVPPSLPGMRLVVALRTAFRRAGGRIQMGEAVARVEQEQGRVARVVVPAAARDLIVQTGAVVLATGGIAGGGLVATSDGRLHEAVLDLPVEAPAADAWLAADPFEPAGHPLEAAGVRTDAELRPVDGRGHRPLAGVSICGSLLAGQRYLRERCGDGVAIASARRAALAVLEPSGAHDPRAERLATASRSRRRPAAGEAVA